MKVIGPPPTPLSLQQKLDNLYKDLTHVSKLLKKAEEDAQAQMLTWENFVI